MSTDAELLAQRIRESGLPKERFAEECLLCSPRALFYWLSGKPMPPRIRAWVLNPTPRPWPLTSGPAPG
jgi:hypothetical protein